MTVSDQYDGSADPFEGDRTIIWRSLPSNAKVTKATLGVSPAAAPGGNLFEEQISFTGGLGNFGSTKTAGAGFVEIDFHKRRTLSGVAGAGVRTTTATPGAHLQADLGGLYVEINDKGALRIPNDTLFTVPADGLLPGLTLSKFKLTSTANVDVSAVNIRSVPTNVTVKVGTLSPFWSHLGELSAADQSPDFSVVLQAYLAHADVMNGFYAIPFAVHSDTLARLRIELTVDFVAQATLQPNGLKEVVVPFDFDTRQKTRPDILSVDLPPNAYVLPGLTTAKIVGAFSETRVVHGVPPGSPPPPYAVGVSPDESQGQVILLNEAVSATAIDLLLAAVTPSARLNLDVRGDLDGKPDGLSLLHAPAPVDIVATLTLEPSWVSIPLPVEFTFPSKGAAGAHGNPPFWLVLSSLEGEALWSTQPAPGSVGVQHTLDGGLSWHYSGSLGTSGPLDASFRLRNKPPLFQIPVHLNIGTGAPSAPVSLDRYQPLGKVDLTLDTPDLSGAFNQYLSAGVAPACPLGEHLVNGGFEQWAVAGNDPGTPFDISLSGVIAALSTTSDGRYVYLAGSLGSGQKSNVQIIDSVCDTLLTETIALDLSDTPAGIVANPAGDRLFVVSATGLCIVDAAARAQIGSALPASALAGTSAGSLPVTFSGAMAVSPDGRVLYAIQGFQSSNVMIAVDTATLEQVSRGLRDPAGLVPRKLSLPGMEVQALALSPDGKFLYVAISQSTGIVVIDTSPFERAGSDIQLTDQPVAIDFTPDGKFALVLTEGQDTRIHLLDTAANADTRTIFLGTDAPTTVVASPDGTRGYALLSPSESDSALIVVDLSKNTAGAPIPLSSSGEAMAISPHGDRIYVSQGSGSVVTIPLGTRSPAEWFVTSDTPATPAQVFPFCSPQPAPFDLAVLFAVSPLSFAPNTIAAGLSQVVPVAGPCRYEFSFFGLADDSGALAEIFWLDQQSTLLRTDSEPIPVRPEPAGSRFGATTVPIPSPAVVQFPLQRARFDSPSGAAQAEVRFSSPPFVSLVVAAASLKGTPETLSNGDFQLSHNGLPDGWTLNAQYSRGVSFTLNAGIATFLNSSAGDAELVQTVTIGENRQFVWELKGRPATVSAGQQPSGELRWLKADGSAAGPSTKLPIGTAVFPRYPASGTTPAGTMSAEIHLKAPAGTGLEIAGVSLQTPQTANVPVTFVAQAPGELRVSRSQVTYDVVPAPPPPVPSGGLATPTPPGSRPGDPPCSAYCSCCGGEQPLVQTKSAITPAGRPLTIGVCPNCGSALTRPGGRLSQGAALISPPMLAPHRRASGFQAPRRVTAPLPPLTALPGIGEGRAKQLTEIGITSLEHLAGASADEVARPMKGVSTKHAADFIARAKQLLAFHGHPPVPAKGGPGPSSPTSPEDTGVDKENSHG